MAIPAFNQLQPGVPHGEIDFWGEQFFCDHHGAMFWPSKNYMIVSDLHLEKGAAMAAHGFMAPPYDSAETLDRLQDCIERWNPHTIISLGDSFHRKDSAGNLSSCIQARIKNLTANYDWRWITGNHDPNAPENLGGSSAFEISIGPLCFRHEQENPTQAGEISGHLHPAAKLHRRGKTLRRRCFVSDGKRLIMPAFGSYTGGLDLFHNAFDQLLDKNNMQIWMLGNERVYRICAKSLVTK